MGLKSQPHVVAHSIGAMFNVDKVGDIESLRVRGGRALPFLRRGKDMRGVENWIGRLTIDDGRVFTVRFLDGKDAHQLYIYLHEYAMTAEDLEKTPQELIDLNQQAQDAANHLMKYGSWRLGLPEVFRGAEPHYVVESEPARALAKALGPGAVLKDGTMVDKSHPKGLEIHGNRELARKALDFGIADLNDLPTLREAIIRQIQLSEIHQQSNATLREELALVREELALVREFVGLEINRRREDKGNDNAGVMYG